MVLEGTKTCNLKTFEDSELLTAIKQSVISSFIGIPNDAVAQENHFEAYDVVLRDKKMVQGHCCSYCCNVIGGACTKRMTPCCEDTPLFRLTFGVQCRFVVCWLVWLVRLIGML